MLSELRCLSAMAASLTKEQLKNELISHGVQPPLQSARKEEFVKLYEQHVAPIVAQKGDFSSDEETEPTILDTKVCLTFILCTHLSITQLYQQVPASNNSLICNGVDVAALSDEELFEKLQAFGIAVGPIVGELTAKNAKISFIQQLYFRNYTWPLSAETGCSPAKWLTK